MARMTLPERVDMTDEQRRVYDATLSGRRGRVPAPLVAWLASPTFADRAQSLGEFVRYDTTLTPRLSELAILLVARHWTSAYEWFAHKPEALKGGLDPAIVDAIAQRRLPRFEHEDERAVYEFVVMLHETKGVSDALYSATVDRLGQRRVVELVGLLGYYTLISMTLNVFEIGAPDGAATDLIP
jgi:4-carboxymuconolactone decarboxylase